MGTGFGLVVFLLLMLASVQILFDLHATTLVTASAREAARSVAGHDASTDRCAAAAAADRRFVEALGDYGRAGHARLHWTCTDPELVIVRIEATHPSILPAGMRGLLSLGRLERTIEIRVERAR